MGLPSYTEPIMSPAIAPIICFPSGRPRWRQFTPGIYPRSCFQILAARFSSQKVADVMWELSGLYELFEVALDILIRNRPCAGSTMKDFVNTLVPGKGQIGQSLIFTQDRRAVGTLF